MIPIGKDLDGMDLVVGRAMHHGDMLPAKVKPAHGVAYVCHNGLEHIKHDFEVKVKDSEKICCLMGKIFTWQADNLSGASQNLYSFR